nr:hypothetical protein [Tanacetum cinerariifolium]
MREVKCKHIVSLLYDKPDSKETTSKKTSRVKIEIWECIIDNSRTFNVRTRFQVDLDKSHSVKRAPTFHQHYATTSTLIATISPTIDSKIGPSASQVGLVYNWYWLWLIHIGLGLAELEDLCSLVAHLLISLNQEIWECIIDNSRTFNVRPHDDQFMKYEDSKETKSNNLGPVVGR